MSECVGTLGGECPERPSGRCDSADGPDLCMAYWRWAARKQRARADAAEKRVVELEKDAERLATALEAQMVGEHKRHPIHVRCPLCDALRVHEALRGTK